MEINQEVTLIASGYTHDGQGVCKNQGAAVFVPGMVSGEEALVRITSVGKKFCRGEIINLITKSKDRVTPSCAHFPLCGGCDYRHIDYGTEIEIKQSRIRAAYKKIAGIEAADIPMHPSQTEVRNKVTLQMFYDGRLRLGFYEKKSHSLTDCRGCLFMSAKMELAADKFLRFANDNNLNLNGSIAFRENRNGDEMSLLITADRRANLKGLKEALPEVTCCSILIKDKYTHLFGKEYITDSLCGNILCVSPLSFYQINPTQAETAYNLALDLANCSEADTALDLCCGIGSITLALARRVKEVYGAEIVAKAIENANNNAKLNEITNAHFTCGDAGAVAAQYIKKGIRPTVIVVDPPRAGLSPDCVEAIIKLSPKTLAYISCDCETQARDIKALLSHSYTLTALHGVDFFKRTAHIESIAILEKPDTLKESR